MTISEYMNIVLNTNKDVFCKEELEINEDFDTSTLLKLCSNNLSKERITVAWEMIVSAVAEKYKNIQNVMFFPDLVLDFLIEKEIALAGLSHIKLPKIYLQKIYDKDKQNWEALKNINS